MNVWLVQIGALPVKPGIQRPRAAHLAEKLVQRGHTVLWWANCSEDFENYCSSLKISFF